MKVYFSLVFPSVMSQVPVMFVSGDKKCFHSFFILVFRLGGPANSLNWFKPFFSAGKFMLKSGLLHPVCLDRTQTDRLSNQHCVGAIVNVIVSDNAMHLFCCCPAIETYIINNGGPWIQLCHCQSLLTFWSSGLDYEYTQCWEFTTNSPFFPLLMSDKY